MKIADQRVSRCKCPTCPKGKEETLVRVLFQQGFDPTPHPLVPLGNEFQSEVTIDLLGGHLLAGQHRHIVESGNLRTEQNQQIKALEQLSHRPL